MQYLLKSMLLAVITVFGMALTIVPAHAQNDSRVVANIPFEFSVGNTTLKAGNYRVEQLESGLISLSSQDGKEQRFALTFPGTSDEQKSEPYLVFIRYGNESFLRKISISDDHDCLELPESSRERELIKNQAGAEVSLLIQPAR